MGARAPCIVLLFALQLKNIEAECYHEKIVYANGEQLQLANEDCKTCYCQEGKVQCTEVYCFIRTDCEGKIVPGKCCPSYDHCPPAKFLTSPPINSTKLSLINSSKEIEEIWPLNKIIPNLNQRSINATAYTNTFQDAVKIDKVSLGNQKQHTNNFNITNIEQSIGTPISQIGTIKNVLIPHLRNHTNEPLINTSKILKLSDSDRFLKFQENYFEFNNTIQQITKSAQIDSAQVPKRSIIKREIPPHSESDGIFKQLEIELNVENTERVQTEDEEKKESDKVFRELSDEINNPSKFTKKGDKDSDSLQGITDIIAKLTLRGRKNSLESSNILGMLSNIFSMPYRRYNRQK